MPNIDNLLNKEPTESHYILAKYIELVTNQNEYVNPTLVAHVLRLNSKYKGTPEGEEAARLVESEKEDREKSEARSLLAEVEKERERLLAIVNGDDSAKGSKTDDTPAPARDRQEVLDDLADDAEETDAEAEEEEDEDGADEATIDEVEDEFVVPDDDDDNEF